MLQKDKKNYKIASKNNKKTKEKESQGFYGLSLKAPFKCFLVLVYFLLFKTQNYNHIKVLPQILIKI